jgi:hypothetical protein
MVVSPTIAAGVNNKIESFAPGIVIPLRLQLIEGVP